MNLIPLTIPASNRTFVQTLIDSLEIRKSDCVVSFIIDKSDASLTLVSGVEPFCVEMALTLDPAPKKSLSFSLDGSYFAQILTYFPDPEQDIELTLNRKLNGENHVALIHNSTLLNDKAPEEFALRTCECKEVDDTHVDYLKKKAQRSTFTIRKTAIERVIHEATNNLPFDYIEFNKDKQTIKIQRDNAIEEKVLPSNMNIPMNMQLTEEATRTLTHMCENLTTEEIDINLQGEDITFISPTFSSTLSLAGIDIFLTKKADTIKPLLHFMLDFYHFKAEIKHCQTQYSKIKKANQAILYLEPDSLTLCSLIKPYQFIKPIKIFGMGNEKYIGKGLALRFCPKEISDIKIKDLTCAKKIKMMLYQNLNGEYKLGCYNSEADTLPLSTFSVEKDNDAPKAIQPLLESFNAIQGESKPSHEEQPDLFNF
ncbi:hypothetical protein HC723_13265 [Vibrio sp. S11_S32]|uniref:hypothetical protein n=1 Tax=Vibrio sp. S11_S32 TaxID=2720225 RepID=UPI0016816AD1|nr:hypothetical protein [Vibrio sp. S11_S32]MBD1577398.1 hypothetical protein [Vibrio sp. S11_S32]